MHCLKTFYIFWIALLKMTQMFHMLSFFGPIENVYKRLQSLLPSHK